MDRETVAFLRSEPGRAAVAELGVVEDDALLETLERLRRTLDHARAAGVVETARLRRRAAGKFEDPDRMLFTSDGLEQASGTIVARRRSAGFAGVARIADLGCGIGGDAIHLARMAPLVAVERDEVTAAVAAHNLETAAHVVQGDAVRPPFDVSTMAVFLDPGRRGRGSRRVFDPRAYAPPFDIAVAIARFAVRAAIKCAPGLPHDAIPDDAGSEFVSVGGDLKECVLWFGAGWDPRERRAVLADRDAAMVDVPAPPGRTAPVGAWLVEPDPAVIRAGLVANLADRLDCAFLDPEIAYLTGDRPTKTPFARAFRVESVHPFQLKRLRAHLRALDVGSLTIKKRGFPMTPEQLRRRLDLSGSQHRVLIVTRVAGRPLAVIAFEPQPTVRAHT